MKVYQDNSLSIGNTPMVRLNRLTAGLKAQVLVKVEGRNPSYSIKSRIGASMIWAAEREGILKPGSRAVRVVEATSGNTGIALAFVCAARGYPLTLTMPASMSVERQHMLRSYGADLILTPAEEGMKGSLEAAQALHAQDPSAHFLPKQFENPANPQIHVETTGPEIDAATEGAIDLFVAGVGTGGTLTGVSRYFKTVKGVALHTVAVEPTNSPVISQTRAGEALVPGKHGIQGMGPGFIPGVLGLDMIDEVALVETEEALEISRRLAREEGLTCGISAGANVAAALRLAADPRFAGKTIVTVLPDAGERYLSTALFGG